ncbi:response regulator [Butyrivibrio sp. VCB2001]|uniref:response regulator n=1 Tax=Butyrivibrio sp. VCB2001 TaxID=1280667 RepID=UPI0003FB1AC9|nr:response regulator [Butyrivibrio sp. VCB2001]
MENNKSRVLIVDDMRINRIVLASILATHGITSDQAESGIECIDLCKANDYDLVLLDHRMPELDGVDTLVRLKEMFKERGKDVPIICHTTEEGRSNVNLYKAAGFADVLIKPVDPRELYEAIMMYLGDEEHSSDTEEDTSYDSGLSDAEIVSGERSGDYEIDVKKEIEKLPVWLKIIPQLDLGVGVTNCGDYEDYLDALYIFYSSVDEKADELGFFLEYEDWTMYALRVHSLKSMARLVGAKKLGKTAAMLEAAAREENYSLIKRETGDFLKAYREFKNSLSPIENEEIFANKAKESEQISPVISKENNPFHRPSILYIQSGEGIVKKGIVNNLTEAKFNVITIPDEPDRIITGRNEADIVIYNPGSNDASNISITMNLLGEICQDDSKILCLTGELTDINKAMASNGSHRVSRTYPRPVDIGTFVNDMVFYTELETDFHRKKTIFVVDDDPAYLSVIHHWLSSLYNVQCFNSGSEMLSGLSTVTPDLLLLDLEMPKMDGFDLMKIIRTDYTDPRIPIILLTGNSNKDIVFHVLEYKPDGYLLKTSPKENILDVIRRFFAESMFKLAHEGKAVNDENT